MSKGWRLHNLWAACASILELPLLLPTYSKLTIKTTGLFWLDSRLDLELSRSICGFSEQWCSPQAELGWRGCGNSPSSSRLKFVLVLLWKALGAKGSLLEGHDLGCGTV